MDAKLKSHRFLQVKLKTRMHMGGVCQRLRDHFVDLLVLV